MKKKILIIGLRMAELRGNPQETLLGNPMRSWALYEGLKQYGFETKLFLGRGCRVDEQLSSLHNKNFILDAQDFIEQASKNTTSVVICGTRIHETLKQHPWLTQLHHSRIVLAQCYHNVPEVLAENFLSQIKHALFVTPKYVHSWNRQYPNIPTSIMTTGQIEQKKDATEANGDAIFVGHIHNHSFLNLIAKLAAAEKNRNFHVVTSRIIKKHSQEYESLSNYESNDRLKIFKDMVKGISGSSCPKNLIYHFLLPGDEKTLMDKVSIGIDFTWSPEWVLDNSKVPYYLSYGLNVIAHLPAPSHRFVTKFNAGVQVEQGAPLEKWIEAIKSLSSLCVEEKNVRRKSTALFFSWDNVVFDVASILLEIT